MITVDTDISDDTDIEKPRAGLLDEIRGGDIIAMALYHLGYDLVYLFGVHVPYYREFATPYIQPLIAGTFIVLSGIACRYSKSNLKRGIKTFLLGLLLTAATSLLIPGEAIYFGILHFMGSAMVIFWLLRPVLDKLGPLPGILVFLALYIVTLPLPRGYIQLPGVFAVDLPAALYRRRFLLPLGFYGAGSDYFPLMPHLFLYLAASYAGVLCAGGRFPGFAYRTRCKFLSWMGRHTIVIYLLHQPVVMGILYLFFQK